MSNAIYILQKAHLFQINIGPMHKMFCFIQFKGELYLISHMLNVSIGQIDY